MGYTVSVDIKSSEFPGLGNPVYPLDYARAKDSLPKEVKSKVKDQYESYYRNASKARTTLKNLNPSTNFNNDEMRFDFDYEEGIPKTYKFLGMDVDDNYEAVIMLGDGYVHVAPLFDSNEIAKSRVATYGNGRFDDATLLMANDIISKSTQDLARIVSTSLKNGALYDLYRTETRSFDPISGNSTPVPPVDIADLKQIRLEHLDPLVQLVKGKISNGNASGEASARFKSVLLSLVDREKRRDQESRYKDTGNTADLDSTVAAAILSKLFVYWSKVIDKYNSYNSVLSELDLWSNLGKTCMGDAAFNSKMMGCMSMTDKDTGERINSRILSFAGVSRDYGINDANTIRNSVKEQVDRISSVVSGDTSHTDIVMQDLMLGNVEYEDFSNPYDLSAEELQAVSSYDSLKYIDEDAKSCRESYNMDDPEDRSLFIKSAIKSYDRNFRAFKSRNDYDVAQAFSDMIENGVTFGDRIVSRDSVVGEPDLTSYEVTSSEYTINRAVIKKSLVKIGKLLNKPLSDINDLFSSIPQNSTNP